MSLVAIMIERRWEENTSDDEVDVDNKINSAQPTEEWSSEADITTNTINEITETDGIHRKPSEITSSSIRKESTQKGSNNGPAEVSRNGRSDNVLTTISVAIEAAELYLEQNINRSVSDSGRLATAEE